MQIKIVNIGDELLIGQVKNSNAQWLGVFFAENGGKVVKIETIADDKFAIEKSLAQNEGIDLLIYTGGLGPTKDDLTKETICSFFDSKLQIHKDTLERVKLFFEKRRRNLTDNNYQQALLPDNCVVLKNSQGTAPGMLFEKDETLYVFVPGVPYEMKAILSEELLPLLKERFELKPGLRKTIMTSGIGESFLALKISKWEDSFPSDFHLAFLPSPGIVRLRINSVNNNNESEAIMNALVDQLSLLIPDFIYGYDNVSLEEIVGGLLTQKQLTVATAESCTGGSIGAMITRIPGSSQYFMGGIISYADQIKITELNVSASDISEYGAVSKTVVIQMAEGVRDKYKTDYGIATSGIAGPGGGSEDKPVGLVWIAVAGPHETICKKFSFGHDRERNILMSSRAALNMLRLELV